MKIKEMQPGWHLLLLCAVFLILMPIVFAVSNSFKTMQDAFNTVFQIIPARPTVQNYIHVFSKLPFLRITMNTFLIAATVTVLRPLPACLQPIPLCILILGARESCTLSCWPPCSYHLPLP